MHSTSKPLFILTVSLLFVLRLSAQDSVFTFSIQNTPNPTLQGEWVSDPSSILSSADRAKIEAAINEIYERTSVEIAVVLLPDIKYTLSEFRKILEDSNAREVLSAPQTSQNRRPFPWMILFVYLAILALFHLILLVSVRHTLKQPGSFYDKYLNLRKWSLLFWVFLFPIPYIAVYWWLRKKLQHLRNAPRFGPNTGLPMRRLSETDDDQHLNIGQITEEKIGSVDYDVWVTPGGEEVQILRYARIFTSYEPCPECGYLTFSLSSHQIIEAATHSGQDESEMVHTCKNCHFVKKERTTMPRILSSGGGFSGRGSSGGSGSFGGGRSGGGGGGVSW